MSWREVQWPIPLESKPEIVEMGLAVHGLPIERFRHRGNVWAVHLHRYTANLVIAGEEFPLRPGCISVVRPETEMEFHFRGRSLHFYALFELPPTQSSQTSVRAVQILGKRFLMFHRVLETAVGYFPSQPRRAEAALWDMLWKLADDAPSSVLPPDQSHGREPAAVKRVRHIIEQRLGEPLRVPELAAEVGLSHNHLTRLFHQSLGMTVIAYIQERRVQRAHHLLVHTTRPAKAIALEVGMPDMQALNKMMRRLTGNSPRQIRYQGLNP
jgi:AraC-like DNA-binding protein